ncbi:MAG: ATP-binding protein [Calothrix sp. C42_A2020_038]|nr:ATP-binding protein [Calothrix sp. C42_A2020_038]
MASSLLGRLNAERNRRFVGRVQELALFQNTISSIELPFNILYIYGPGGVGKTSLCAQFMRLCEQVNLNYLSIEARNLESAPESFLGALRGIMGLQESDSPLEALKLSHKRNVLFIDTYENIATLDEWLREEFLPQLSFDSLIVLAGRTPPSPAWRSDPGWQALIRTLPLRNLSSEESLTYLTSRDIPNTQHQTILDFTHGYPLALSLVADVFTQKETSFQPASAPDVIKTLLERFIQDVPSPTHRMALEACAVVRLTTEALLEQMLSASNIRDVFEWLRELSFIESGQLGLFPHDLAREVLIADLRWRHPEFYAELHQRARNYYTVKLGQTIGDEKHRVLFDYMFLHRDNAAIRPRFTWQEHSSLQTDVYRESDKAAILEIVTQYEGKESASIAAHWLSRQPQNVVVFRDSSAIPAGFAIMVELHTCTSQDIEVDAGAVAAWQYLLNNAPLRSHEGATIFRFWMARDTYQGVSPTQSLIFINFVQYFQKTPGLAYTFLPCAEPEMWAPMLTYFDLKRLQGADFLVNGRRKYGVYGHDWRLISPEAWRELLARREIDAKSEVEVTTTPRLLVLSEPDFIEAVYDALKNLTRTNALHNSPLLYSHLIEDKVKSNDIKERVSSLQTLIKQTAESLQASPRDEKLYRALHRTYISPAPTQEQAAELLDLPFSTYRRHLKAGMERVAEILWQQEIN